VDKFKSTSIEVENSPEGKKSPIHSDWSLSFDTSLSMSGFQSAMSPNHREADQKFEFKFDENSLLNFDQNNDEYLIPIPEKIYQRFEGQH
jgi:hypothetical protein